MCKSGDTVVVDVPDIRKRWPARGIDIAEVNPSEMVPRDIDRCIAPIVKALNDQGVATVQSCCGHGKGFGTIELLDGRVLAITGGGR